jgi:hypothetical protein
MRILDKDPGSATLQNMHSVPKNEAAPAKFLLNYIFRASYLHPTPKFILLFKERN